MSLPQQLLWAPRVSSAMDSSYSSRQSLQSGIWESAAEPPHFTQRRRRIRVQPQCHTVVKGPVRPCSIRIERMSSSHLHSIRSPQAAHRRSSWLTSASSASILRLVMPMWHLYCRSQAGQRCRSPAPTERPQGGRRGGGERLVRRNSEHQRDRSTRATSSAARRSTRFTSLLHSRWKSASHSRSKFKDTQPTASNLGTI